MSINNKNRIIRDYSFVLGLKNGLRVLDTEISDPNSRKGSLKDNPFLLVDPSLIFKKSSPVLSRVFLGLPFYLDWIKEQTSGSLLYSLPLFDFIFLLSFSTLNSCHFSKGSQSFLSSISVLRSFFNVPCNYTRLRPPLVVPTTT